MTIKLLSVLSGNRKNAHIHAVKIPNQDCGGPLRTGEKGARQMHWLSSSITPTSLAVLTPNPSGTSLQFIGNIYNKGRYK